MRCCDDSDADRSTSEANDQMSSASDDIVPPPAPKKRKSTYYARKEAIETLHGRVEELQQELTHAGSISKATPHLLNIQYQDQIKRNHQFFAGLASVLASYKQATRSLATTPLTSFIHLPKHQDDRDNNLRGLYKFKVDAAFRFMLERTRFLDLSLRHFHEELVHEPSGETVSTRLDVTSFERRFSLRQVYEALKFYLVNQEKILTEASGNANREAYNDVYNEEFHVGQVQLSSPIVGGDVEIKSNWVTFLSFVEEPTPSVPIGGHAIATSDFVNQDDLEPHPSTLNVREELTSAVLVTEAMTPAGAVVSLSKWEHSRFHPPKTQPLTRLQTEELHATGKQRWDTMLHVMRERLETLW